MCHVQINENAVMVLKALGRRLGDSNNNLRPKALSAIALLAKNCGNQMCAHLKSVGKEESIGKAVM